MIRKANKFDIPFIVEILKNYRDAAPHKILNKANDKEYIEQLLFNLIVGSGFILLAEKDNLISYCLFIMHNFIINTYYILKINKFN
jgi:hypothetical protein